MKDFSIVFMGTPEFAETILARLHAEGLSIKAVVTAPDKPAGRGQKVHTSAVKDFALDHELPLLQPSNLKDVEFLTELQGLEADLFVVVAFRMLPEAVWSMPPMGTINLHASLLPQYRGAAPINWAIINGESSSGVSTFFIEREIDTGKIIEQAEVSIGKNETVGELYERLMHLGAEVMVSTIEKIRSDEAIGIDQSAFDVGELKPAPKIFRDDCRIDFTLTCQQVHNFCRGLNPYPSAWCTLVDTESNSERQFKIHGTRTTELPSVAATAILSDPEGLLFPCSDYYLRVLELQPEGKRKMKFKEYLAGNSIASLITKGF